MPNKIIGADYCPYCAKVKSHFIKNNIPFEWIDTETSEGAAIREEESSKHKYDTIPMVFIDDKFIGGCDDFFAKYGKQSHL